MKSLECELPLYDYTRLQGTSVHKINYDDFFTIYDEEIGELTSEEKLILKRQGLVFENFIFGKYIN